MLPDDDPIPPCPHCGAERVVPIVYGSPSARGSELVRRGEAALGGCSISAGSPRWRCRACHHEFGDHQDVFGRLFSDAARPDGSR